MGSISEDQQPLHGGGKTFEGFEAAVPLIEDSRAFRVPPSFKLRAVDPTAALQGVPGDDSLRAPVAPDFESLEFTPGELEAFKALGGVGTNASEEPPLDDRHLGALDDFVGNFVGNGLNIIFRPRNGPQMNGLSETLLEINVTKETLQFLSRDILKQIPNRGFGGPEFALMPLPEQRDVILRGIPYLQQITDLIDQTSLTLREPGVAIHFEQGLFLRTPSLTRPPLPPTISRLASIPHGTTINAQCPDPTVNSNWTEGRPDISGNLIDTLPFGINPDQDPTGGVPAFKTLQLNPTRGTRDRIPNRLQPNVGEDNAALEAFSQLNAIQHFAAPVRTLIDYNNTKNIIKHRHFKVDSKHRDVSGGGVANIGFLQGDDGVPQGTAPSNANANAVRVTCDYWISVVRVEIALGPTAHQRVEVQPPVQELHGPIPNGVKYFHPTFIVNLKRPLRESIKFDVDYVQIQYAQNVTLDFGRLSWPHVSVASLIPAGLDQSGKIELNSEQLPAALL